MNQKTYDLSLLAGTLLVTAGATASWGLPTGLLVAGGLVIALTLFGAIITRRGG
jgi:hypothetical protein